MTSDKQPRPKGKSHIGMNYTSESDGTRLFSWQWIHSDDKAHIIIDITDGFLDRVLYTKDLRPHKQAAIRLARYYYKRLNADDKRIPILPKH